MDSPDHDCLTRSELMEKIRRLEALVHQDRKLQELVHELEVHQEEIRTQNHQLIEAQSALEASRDRYADLYDFAPLAYVTLDAQGSILEINLTGSQLLGIERGHILGMPFLSYVAEGDHERFFEHLRRCVDQGRQVTSELRLHRKGSSPVTVSLNSSEHTFREERRTFRTIIVDLTERHRSEDEKLKLIAKERSSEARNEAKDRFMAILSHELRTPLMPILAVIGELEAAPGLSEVLRSDLLMIHRNVELEARLIDDLLDLTSISRGKLKLNPTAVDVHQLIGFVLETLKESYQSKDLHLSVRLEATYRYVVADSGRLQQVLWNVVKNSIKFTPREGSISILTWNRGHESSAWEPSRSKALVFEVTDSGIGIESEKLPLLFNAFEQTEEGITREFGGLGLGLAISRGLVEAHHGRISVSSAGKGKGATFTVEPPSAPAPAPIELTGGEGGATAAGRHAAAVAGAGSRRFRVLLVEDHLDSARIISRLLARHGYEVATANSLESALQVATQPFDLLISDLGLPDGSGLELMKKLRARGLAIAGIALSGFGTEQDIERSREAGFNEHLTKPVDFSRISETIDRVMNLFQK